jgi:hypothetical protein
VNFFMADMQSGIRPFGGVFLLERGWASGMIGTALAVGNITGMFVTTPVGGFIDASRRKRAWVIVPSFAMVSLVNHPDLARFLGRHRVAGRDLGRRRRHRPRGDGHHARLFSVFLLSALFGAITVACFPFAMDRARRCGEAVLRR